MKARRKLWLGLLAGVAALTAVSSQASAQQQKRPNIVMLMSDDTGWTDLGAYLGGANLGHPTPNLDRLAKEGAMFTSWYGQASCTAGRASFMTGRIPIRSALSVVVAPGDENFLHKETPTIAEFFKKNGYSTYFSGKWHLGDKPEAYPIEHGFETWSSMVRWLRARRRHRREDMPGWITVGLCRFSNPSSLSSTSRLSTSRASSVCRVGRPTIRFRTFRTRRTPCPTWISRSRCEPRGAWRTEFDCLIPFHLAVLAGHFSWRWPANFMRSDW